jgi:ribosome-associated translation inhibitor RaiA
MQTALRITMRDLEPTASLDVQIRDHAAKLDKLFSRLTGCHVTIDSPHRHKLHGNHFRVRIELSVPGAELVVTRDPSNDRTHEDAHAAVDAAFAEAARLLKDRNERQRSLRRSA